MGMLGKLFGRGAILQRTTAENPLRIKDPIIGFLNLQGVSGAALAESDGNTLAPLFSRSQTADTAAPRCTVLFIYATLDRGGNIIGRSERIRDLAKEAGAYVVVVASSNPSESYIEALKPSNDWHANFTMTLDRKGNELARYFGRIFGAMFAGRSMLMAWVDLAPQSASLQDPNSPVMFMSAEAGHITFRA